MTPYHAIKLAPPKLNKAGSAALVIGLGGLGLLAVQILRAMTGATVIATDTKESAIRQAEKYGATTVPSGDGQVDAIRELTAGRGVDAVFDMVDVGPTVQTAMASVGTQGRVSVVGLGSAGSDYGWQWYKEPYEAELVKTYWGTLPELLDGQVSGRAIIVP
ncbi:zinc-binding dehydrogenase [Corynebacterium ureicelerivorans]